MRKKGGKGKEASYVNPEGKENLKKEAFTEEQ